MNLKNWVIGIAILILTIFVSYYGINIFLPKYQYDDFCDRERVGPKICPAVCVPMYNVENNECVFTECGSVCGPVVIYSFSDLGSCEESLKISEQKKCELQNGTWVRQQIECIRAPCPQGYCDLYSKCSQEFNDANELRSKKVFFVALPLGILIIILGLSGYGIYWLRK